MRRHFSPRPLINAPYDLRYLGTILHVGVLMTTMRKLTFAKCARLPGPNPIHPLPKDPIPSVFYIRDLVVVIMSWLLHPRRLL